ncbi:insulinase family protein [Treponema sp.]|uniref:insulinase family protein n=1 Tax=Treponema sp. TaxID=166 RepID=UPI00388E3A63
MKRYFFLLLVFFSPFYFFAFSKNDVDFFTLENGLKIYVLEDNSSPTIRIELCVNAGFTEQTPENAGFFTLYARLLNGEISNDSVRFTATVAPGSIEKAVLLLSEKLKPLQPNDSELNSLLKIMTAEFKEYESSATGFINTAIDSRIFPDAPWTRESGISSSDFSSKTKSEVRTILKKISENYYTASNSTVFINGNISKNTALAVIQKYFSDFSQYNSKKQDLPYSKLIQEQISKGNLSKGRKFVLAHKDFSDEMTQIVVQYKNLSDDECDVLAQTWNRDGSAFKKLLLKQRNLKILGDEYIDISSAREKSASRVIIQSLLGNAKVSPVVQTDLFLTMSRDEDVFSEKELKSTLKKIKTEYTRLSESSTLILEQLSDYISSHDSASEKSADFFDKNNRLSEIKSDTLKEKINQEEPFVFVLLNSAVYQKYAQEFTRAGFTQINQKDSAWYNQIFYKNIIASKAKKSDSDINLLEEISKSAQNFISRNMAEFSFFKLINNIPVTVKRSENSNTAVLSMTIEGGELLFTDKVPGLSSVLTDSIAVNINSQLDLFASNGAVTGFYEVSAQTLSTHSIITITCLAKEIDFALQAAYSALVYCDINPATADGVTYDERTQWRLKSGSSEFQLLCEAIRILYEKTDYPKLYKDTEEKPASSLDFTKILESYPVLLDSTRISLILTGSLKDNEKLAKSLNSTFGLLGSIKETESKDLALPRPDFSSLKQSEKRISIRHLFLTDISKDKAGPRPQILIPTTKFLDPVLYCFASPDLSSTDCALFNSILIEIAERMENILSKKYPETKVKAKLPENDIPFARIVVTNVEHTSEIDSVYAQTVQSLKTDITKAISIQTGGVIDLEKTELLSKFENNWLMRVIAQAENQTGTAKLIQTGEVQKNPKLYLEQYAAIDKANPEDYFLITESYFTDKIPLALYSKDSKK